jgi:hypothetical protein
MGALGLALTMTTCTSQGRGLCTAFAPQVSVRRRDARDPCSKACSNAADFAAVRECSPLSESLALLRIRTLTNIDERAAEVWGLEGHRSPKCPAAVGCRRLSSGICGECARKLSMEGTFSLVTGLPLMVCKSIAKASKVRILHLPPRAQRAPDLRKRRSGALLIYLVGVSKTTLFWRSSGCWVAGL